VTAWGWNGFGQCDVPKALGSVVRVSAGERHSIALDASLRVVCWGSDEQGQSTPPAGSREAVEIAAGNFHSAAIRADGSIACWGWNAFGQCDVPIGLRRAVAVAAGYGHTLILDDLGSVRAWGDDVFGQVSGTAAVGISTRLESGIWSAAAFEEPCDGAPRSPADCACGPIQADLNEDGVADCLSFRFGDLDLDGAVTAQDLAILLSNWGDRGPLLGDLNRDGAVSAQDLTILLGRFGESI
jgi:hypothetical protein